MAETHIRTFDQRIVEMILRDGSLSEKDFRQFLKNLPDLDGQWEEVQIPLPGQRSSHSAGRSSSK
jgi:hypothetical protein